MAKVAGTCRSAGRTFARTSGKSFFQMARRSLPSATTTRMSWRSLERCRCPLRWIQLHRWLYCASRYSKESTSTQNHGRRVPRRPPNLRALHPRRSPSVDVVVKISSFPPPWHGVFPSRCVQVCRCVWVWRGVVWCGVVWCGVVCVVWCGVVRCGVVRSVDVCVRDCCAAVPCSCACSCVCCPPAVGGGACCSPPLLSFFCFLLS